MELSKRVRIRTQFSSSSLLIILLYLLSNTTEARFQNGKVTGGFDCSKNSSVFGPGMLNSSREFVINSGNNFQIPLVSDIGGNGSVGDNRGGERARDWGLRTRLSWWTFVTKPIRPDHNNINHGAAYGYCDVSDKNTQQSSTTKIDNESRKLEIDIWLIAFGVGLLVACFLSNWPTSCKHYGTEPFLAGQVVLCLLQFLFLVMAAAIPRVEKNLQKLEDNGNEVDPWSNYCLANSTSYRRIPISPVNDLYVIIGILFSGITVFKCFSLNFELILDSNKFWIHLHIQSFMITTAVFSSILFYFGSSMVPVMFITKCLAIIGLLIRYYEMHSMKLHERNTPRSELISDNNCCWHDGLDFFGGLCYVIFLFRMATLTSDGAIIYIKLVPFALFVLLYFGLIFISMLIYLTWEYLRKSVSEEEVITETSLPGASQIYRSVRDVENDTAIRPARVPSASQRSRSVSDQEVDTSASSQRSRSVSAEEVNLPAASRQVPRAVRIMIGETNDFNYTVDCFTYSLFGFSIHGKYFEIQPESCVGILLSAEPDIATYEIYDHSNGLLVVSVKNSYGTDFIYQVNAPYPVSSRDLTASRYNDNTIEIVGPSRSHYYPNHVRQKRARTRNVNLFKRELNFA